MGNESFLLVKVNNADNEDLKSVGPNQQQAFKTKQERDYLKAIYGQKDHDQQENQSLLHY